MDYARLGEEVAQKLQNYCNSDENWKEVKEGKGYKILCRKSSEFEGYLYKGIAEFNAPPRVVFDYVEPLPDGPRLKWDKTMKNIEILKQIDSDLRINRACTHSAAMGLISPRDFVDLIRIKETDEYISTNGKIYSSKEGEGLPLLRGRKHWFKHHYKLSSGFLDPTHPQCADFYQFCYLQKSDGFLQTLCFSLPSSLDIQVKYSCNTLFTRPSFLQTKK